MTARGEGWGWRGEPWAAGIGGEGGRGSTWGTNLSTIPAGTAAEDITNHASRVTRPSEETPTEEKRGLDGEDEGDGGHSCHSCDWWRESPFSEEGKRVRPDLKAE